MKIGDHHVITRPRGNVKFALVASHTGTARIVDGEPVEPTKLCGCEGCETALDQPD